MQDEIESSYEQSTKTIEAKAVEAYKQSPKAAIEILTNYSDSVSMATHERYRKLGEYLFVKNLDGRVKKEKDGQFECNEYGYPVGPEQPGYSKEFYDRIVKSRGEHFRFKDLNKK